MMGWITAFLAVSAILVWIGRKNSNQQELGQMGISQVLFGILIAPILLIAFILVVITSFVFIVLNSTWRVRSND